MGVLAGVHRGFSSVAPGQPDSVEPEYSVAYEAGVRHGAVGDDRYVEAIGFFNDYSNMTSECSFSSGCDDSRVGAQFNEGDCWGVFKTKPFDVASIVALSRQLAPGRLVDTDSGGGASARRAGTRRRRPRPRQRPLISAGVECGARNAQVQTTSTSAT